MQIFLALIIFFYVCSSFGYLIYMFSQKTYLYHFSKYTVFLGLFIHSFALIHYGIEYGSFPINSLHTLLLVMSWSVLSVFFIIQYKYRFKLLGIYAIPLGTILMIGSYISSKKLLDEPLLFKSIWLGIHVFTILLGEAALALACGSGILYLIQENSIKKKKRGFFFNRLPSLELVDNTKYACVLSGFFLMTIGLITGIIYAKFIWNCFWSWDPKETWSLITWIFYAVLIYARLILGWRGRKFAIMAIIGFGVLLFTFLGVNFLLRGHHSPFTSF